MIVVCMYVYTVITHLRVFLWIVNQRLLNTKHQWLDNRKRGTDLNFWSCCQAIIGVVFRCKLRKVNHKESFVNIIVNLLGEHCDYWSWWTGYTTGEWLCCSWTQISKWWSTPCIYIIHLLLILMLQVLKIFHRNQNHVRRDDSGKQSAQTSKDNYNILSTLHRPT